MSIGSAGEWGSNKLSRIWCKRGLDGLVLLLHACYLGFADVIQSVHACCLFRGCGASGQILSFHGYGQLDLVQHGSVHGHWPLSVLGRWPLSVLGMYHVCCVQKGL